MNLLRCNIQVVQCISILISLYYDWISETFQNVKTLNWLRDATDLLLRDSHPNRMTATMYLDRRDITRRHGTKIGSCSSDIEYRICKVRLRS